jgi:hypothetical protein
MINILIASLVVIFMQQPQALADQGSKPATVAADTALDLSSMIGTPEQEEAELKAAAKRAERKYSSVAGDLETELAGNADYVELRKKWLAVKNSKELGALLDQLEEKMKAVDEGTTEASAAFRVVAAEVLPLRCMRGMVYRFVPLAEKSKLVQSRLATEVMQLASTMQVFAPTQQWEAGFDYVTQPYDGVTQFKEATDLQAALANGSESCAAMVKTSIQRLKDIKTDNRIVWDNKLLYGNGTFPEGVDRYKMIGPAEKNLAIAARFAALSNIAFFRAYSLKNFFAMRAKIGRLYGFDSITLGRTVEGVTMKDRSDVLRSYDDLFTLRDDGGNYMKISLIALRQAVYFAKLTWNEIEKSSGDQDGYLLSRARFMGFENGIDKNVTKWWEMVKGRTRLQNRITGDTVVVDLPGFFNNPPKDLKILLPVAYAEKEPQMFHGEFAVREGSAVKKQELKYRNYRYARPTSWNKSAYASLFPELKSGNDVDSAIKNVSQSWGGNLIERPLLFYTR